jgi:hypothetical protein
MRLQQGFVFKRSCSMTKWILMGAVVAVGSMFVGSAEAQEQIRPAGTVITSGQPTTQPQRTGILGRLRNRGTMTTTAEPMIAQSATTSQTPAVTVQPSTTTTTPMVVPQQMQVVEGRRGLFGRSRPTYQMVPVTQPMPGTTPSTTSTSGIIQAQGTTTGSGIVQAQGSTTTPGVIQTQGSTTTIPMTTANMTPINEGRQGILSRLRGRLGR